MELFLNIIFSYPVVIYSVLFIIMILYWLVSMMGLIDFGSSEVDADMDIPSPEAGPDLDMDADAGAPEPGSAMGFFSGLLFWFGLHGIPFTIIISLLVIIGWFISSVTMQALPSPLTSGFRGALVGTGVLALSLVLSAWLSGRCISPIRRFLDRNKEDTSPKSLCGMAAIIRSGAITDLGGQAVCIKDGSTFIIQVQKLAGDRELKKDDTAYILEYHPATNTYTVISEERFKGL